MTGHPQSGARPGPEGQSCPGVSALCSKKRLLKSGEIMSKGQQQAGGPRTAQGRTAGPAEQRHLSVPVVVRGRSGFRQEGCSACPRAQTAALTLHLRWPVASPLSKCGSSEHPSPHFDLSCFLATPPSITTTDGLSSGSVWGAHRHRGIRQRMASPSAPSLLELLFRVNGLTILHPLRPVFLPLRALRPTPLHFPCCQGTGRPRCPSSPPTQRPSLHPGPRSLSV